MDSADSRYDVFKIDPAVFTDAVTKFLPVLSSLLGQWQKEMREIFPGLGQNVPGSGLQGVFSGHADPVAYLKLRIQADILRDATNIFTGFVSAKDVVEKINKLNTDLVVETACSSRSIDYTAKMAGFAGAVYEQTQAQTAEEKEFQRNLSRKCIQNICCALTVCAPKVITMAASNGASPVGLVGLETGIVQPALKEFRSRLLKGADALYSKPGTDPQPPRFH